ITLLRLVLRPMLADDEVLLLLGGNVGESHEYLREAEEKLARATGSVIARSRDHWTEPVGFKDDRLFLNRALILRTEKAPIDLLEICLNIESEGGRIRTGSGEYGSRTLDIDILLYGNRVVESSELQIPHPRLHERLFALSPAADICPDALHPTLHFTVLQLLSKISRS
ncbi:MAG TPA: 2-amino-4-hydroxy-6-hydroxymethyldihydropteridine diphosphokinase, partial [Flavobacteriales bacterium]|nr:2-amino-4-hydroxy-6-hydroxymethyldihydropteridine diphosphokinase [Flavobacteriales bacterium]